ncbi:hypothetical protein [Nonomuraea insulae]|uniref:PLD phosphodiesterase domain-containing protein n=1 Tax=Nonomuraea insulae TaxID=1616787 RepID=A0ABW1DCX7_9ACTN
MHSKTSLLDGTWATIGSANLDGASLDFTQHLHKLLPGEVRNTEVNCVILNGVEGQPPTPVVDLLRRRLWAEFLGFESSPGVPDPDHERLAAPPAGGWLKLWRERADGKLERLKRDPADVAPGHVLPWPDVDRTLHHPREHLDVLGVDTSRIDVLKGVRAFSFKEGRYNERLPELDVPPDPRFQFM